VALELADRLRGEIISVDSMQVYRGLDIGTAKPSASDRIRVPHHLIDVAELAESFDAARFIELATAAEAEIRKRGRLPIFCGGTGLYFNAWFNGLGDAPSGDHAIRAELEAAPLKALLVELEAKDPATFAVIDRRNPRRIVRALEVIRLTGKPFSAQRAEWKGEKAQRQAKFPPIFGLRRSAEDLRRRIERRVDGMFADGLVAETRALMGKGLEGNRTAMQALGYRQVVGHLRGELAHSEAVALVKLKTWQFARRQMTWFRNQLPVQWLDVAPNESVGCIANRIMTGRP
jgi:tRNA dimethylallyltransferase